MLATVSAGAISLDEVPVTTTVSVTEAIPILMSTFRVSPITTTTLRCEV